MAADIALVRQAIARLAHVPGVEMDPRALAEDAFLLAESFPDEHDYAAAVLATERALGLVASGRVTSSTLERNQAEWMSYHYQHAVGQGSQADMRLEWQPHGDVVRVRGFGHRWRPADFYRRMAGERPE